MNIKQIIKEEINDFEWTKDIWPDYGVGSKLRLSGYSDDGYYDLEIINSYLSEFGDTFQTKLIGSNIEGHNMSPRNIMSRKFLDNKKNRGNLVEI